MSILVDNQYNINVIKPVTLDSSSTYDQKTDKLLYRFMVKHRKEGKKIGPNIQRKCYYNSTRLVADDNNYYKLNQLVSFNIICTFGVIYTIQHIFDV